MKPISFPKLTLPDSGSRVAPTLGHPLVDDYLESVHARLRPNSTLAVVYDLKVFFTVIDVDPLDVRRRHVLEFIRVQRTGSTDATVVPIDSVGGVGVVDDPTSVVVAGGVLFAPRRARRTRPQPGAARHAGALSGDA